MVIDYTYTGENSRSESDVSVDGSDLATCNRTDEAII